MKLLFCMAALAALLVTHPEVRAESRDFDSVRIGDQISGQFRYGRRVITLPAGNWRLVTKRERDARSGGGGATMLEASLDEVVDARLNRTLQVMLTKYSSTANWIDEPCKALGDAFWIEDRKRSLNDQFCIRVGFLSGVVEAATGSAFEEWARQLLANRVSYSPEMPFVSVVRFTGYDYLRMVIAFNPAPSGVPRSERRERHLNSWNPKSATPDPKIIAFYTSLRAWAPGYAAAVERAFEGDSTLRPSDFGAPALP